MRSFLLALTGLVVVGLLPTYADNFKLPTDQPVVSFTIPASWKPNDYDGGVEAQSADGTIYLSIESVGMSNGEIQSAVKDAVEYLKKKGVTVTEDSLKQKDVELNGLHGSSLSWDGKDEDGPCIIALTVLGVTSDKGLLVTYWGTPDGYSANKKDMDSIANSVAPVK